MIANQEDQNDRALNALESIATSLARIADDLQHVRAMSDRGDAKSFRKG